MEQLRFLLEAFLGGFLVLFSEELVQGAGYSLPTILISYAIGLPLYLLLSRKFNRWATWCIVGLVTALVASVFRLGVVYKGYVSLLTGVDCFAMRNLTNATYVLFGLSGCVAGLLIASLYRLQIRHTGIVGIIIGVLYHLKVASGWWTARLPARQILFLGEFLAPALFVLICYVVTRPIVNSW